MSGYLQDLTARLIDGLDRIPSERRRRHAEFIRKRQGLDGGFAGRVAESDLYYTGFALRSLAILQELTEPVARSCGDYLKTQRAAQASVIDLFSFLVSCSLVELGGATPLAGSPADWRQRTAEVLASFRLADGGYAKSSESGQGSTYHTFLVVLAHELLGIAVPHPAQVVAFVRSRRRPDGGFVEFAAMRRSGTNPTAAALGTLLQLDRIDEATRETAIRFFAELPSPFEGGFRANDRIPAADLLSTFTALWSLAQLDGLAGVDLERIAEYVNSLATDDGGFRGGVWDEVADVEYTFYGLGTLALLAERGIQLGDVG